MGGEMQHGSSNGVHFAQWDSCLANTTALDEMDSQFRLELAEADGASGDSEKHEA